MSGAGDMEKWVPVSKKACVTLGCSQLPLPQRRTRHSKGHHICQPLAEHPLRSKDIETLRMQELVSSNNQATSVLNAVAIQLRGEKWVPVSTWGGLSEPEVGLLHRHSSSLHRVE